MSSISIRGITFLALVAVSAAPLAASIVLPVDFARLCQTAHHVLAGQIIEISPLRDEQTGHIYSDVAILVSHSSPDSLAGHRYTFRMIGGEMDGKRLSIVDFPQLQLNDRVVLFLNDKTSTVFGPTIGLWQGVFFVDNSENATVVDHLRHPVVGVRQKQLLRSAKSAGTVGGISLDDFFDEIKAHRSTASR
ncbi:MAG: hypothetical protein F4X39_02220 [Acidobacteriia bacterium]|nr:hypothetical protein [Terriglobia bacterium]